MVLPLGGALGLSLPGPSTPRQQWTPRGSHAPLVSPRPSSSTLAAAAPSPRTDTRSGRPPPTTAGVMRSFVSAAPPPSAWSATTSGLDTASGVPETARRLVRSVSSSGVSMGLPSRCPSQSSLSDAGGLPVQVLTSGSLTPGPPQSRVAGPERQASATSLHSPLQHQPVVIRHSSAGSVLPPPSPRVQVLPVVHTQAALGAPPPSSSTPTPAGSSKECAAALAGVDKLQKLVFPPEGSEEAITEPDPESEACQGASAVVAGGGPFEETDLGKLEKRLPDSNAGLEEVLRTPRMVSPTRGGAATEESGGSGRCAETEKVAASSSSPARPPVQVRRPSPPKNVFQSLYKDHEARQRRLQAKTEEKSRLEAEALQKQLQATRCTRTFDAGAFSDWYDGNMDQYQSAKQSRKEMHQQEARRKFCEELAECSFSPRSRSRVPSSSRRVASIPTRPGVTSNSASFATSRAQKEEAAVAAASGATTANQLVAEQALQAESLRKLEKKEKEIQATAKRTAAREFEVAVEESKRKLEVFLTTAEGQEYLTSRTKSYMELNQGISEEVAQREAKDDLARASEARLKQQAEASANSGMQGCLQLLQLERLKVARELIQLQRRCQALLSKGEVQSTTLKGFDMQLVERMTSEAWYTKAKENAAKILNKGSSAQPSSGTL